MFYDHTEDFPEVAVDTDPTIVMLVEFVSIFEGQRYQSLVPSIGKDPGAKEDVKEHSQFQSEVSEFYHFI